MSATRTSSRTKRPRPRAKPPRSAAPSRADTDDPAQQPLIEGGEGESEGFELAEKDLEDIAEHGDEHRFPDGMAQPEEPQDPDEYGEADEAIPPDENSELRTRWPAAV